MYPGQQNRIRQQQQQIAQNQQRIAQQQQPVQYVQQPMQGQQPVQYGQPQQPVQYAQPVQQVQPHQAVYGQQPKQPAMVYPNVAKPQGGGGLPPSYGAHKKNKYQLADEAKLQEQKQNYGGGGGGNNNNKGGKGWPQPKQDARGTNPGIQNWDTQTANKCTEDLYKSMKGFGTNERLLVDVTARMNNTQRVKVAAMWQSWVQQKEKKKKKGDTLLKWLKGDLGGNAEDLFLALYKSPAAYDAWWINKDENSLREILCTRTNEQIQDMQAAWFSGTPQGRNRAAELYGDKYRDENKYPSEWFRTNGIVQGKTMREYVLNKYTKSGRFTGHGNERQLYEKLFDANRPANGPVNQQQVKQDAEALNRTLKQDKKHEAKSKFIEIFTARSWTHIAAMSGMFQDISKKWTLQGAMKHTFGSSDTGAALAIIEEFATQPYDYFAKKLRQAMKGLGTKDDNLIRLIVSRSEIDMGNIKQVFGQRYGDGKTLAKWIKGDTSKKEYRGMLLALVGEEWQSSM